MKLKELFESNIITNIGSPNRISWKKIKGTDFVFYLKPRQHMNGHNGPGNPISTFLLANDDFSTKKGKSTKIDEYNFDLAKKIVSSEGYSFPKDLNNIGDNERKKIMAALIIYNQLIKEDKDFFNKFGNKNALSDEISRLKSNLGSSLNNIEILKKATKEKEEKTSVAPEQDKTPQPPRTSRTRTNKKTNLSSGSAVADGDTLSEIKEKREELDMLRAKKDGYLGAIKDIDKEIENINTSISDGEEALKAEESKEKKNKTRIKAIQKDIDDLKVKKAAKEKEKNDTKKEVENLEKEIKTKTDEFTILINK